MEWPGLGPGSVPSSPLLGPACVRPGPTASQDRSSPFLEPTPLPFYFPSPLLVRMAAQQERVPISLPPPCAAVCKTNPFLLPLFSSLSSPNRLLPALTLPPLPPSSCPSSPSPSPSSVSWPARRRKKTLLCRAVLTSPSLLASPPPSSPSLLPPTPPPTPLLPPPSPP